MYEVMIGLEVHVELLTEHKIFCGCRNSFTRQINSNTCEICTGLPGAIPVFNRECIKPAVTAGKILGCRINSRSSFDRKNYFYPDLPKGYQITQFYDPICGEGSIYLPVSDKTIRIREIHLEDDAAKILRDENGITVDYCRCGVPLIEIVTYPDFVSGEEAVEFLDILRRDLRASHVSDCKMEEGSIRADVNLSVRKPGQEPGTRTEMKNLSSFKSVLKACEYEAQRQISVLEEGGTIIRETRRFDEDNGVTLSMRSKEDSADYKYFPEPDIPDVIVDEQEISEIFSSMPELPSQKQKRFEEMGVRREDAYNLCTEDHIAELFEIAAEVSSEPQKTASFILTNYLKLWRDNPVKAEPEAVGNIVRLVCSKTITASSAKTILEAICENGGDPEIYAREHGLILERSVDAVRAAVDKVFEAPENAKAVKEFYEGKEKVRGFLTGKVMKETKGTADPEVVSEILDERLFRK